MEKIKIYKSKDKTYNYIFWRSALIGALSTPIKINDRFSGQDYPRIYSITLESHERRNMLFDFPTPEERDAAFDELTALLERARKQLAERDAKKAEIEAAKELLKDGKRVKIIYYDGTPQIIFYGRVISVNEIDISEVDVNHCAYFRVEGVGLNFYTPEKAERMRNKLIDYIARAKAQLLLEEVEN